jgi:hypothetical protein
MTVDLKEFRALVERLAQSELPQYDVVTLLKLADDLQDLRDENCSLRAEHSDLKELHDRSRTLATGRGQMISEMRRSANEEA